MQPQYAFSKYVWHTLCKTYTLRGGKTRGKRCQKSFVCIIFSIANFYVFVKKIVVAKFTKISINSLMQTSSTTKEILKVVNLINLAPAQISFRIGEIKWNDYYKNVLNWKWWNEINNHIFLSRIISSKKINVHHLKAYQTEVE